EIANLTVNHRRPFSPPKLRGASAWADDLLECQRRAASVRLCWGQSPFRHSTRLKPSLARWTQSRDRTARTSIAWSFCRTLVPGQPRQKNTVRLARKPLRRLKHGFQGTETTSHRSILSGRRNTIYPIEPLSGS